MHDGVVKSVCGYCSTGCRLTVEVTGGQPGRVIPDPEYPVNLGKACPKGFQFLGHLGSEERMRTPLVRDEAGGLKPLDWPAALEVFCRRFKGLQREYGKEAVAFISTGQLVTEEFAFLGALAKFGMGFVHGDGNTRQCMATAAVAHKQSFGFDAPPFTYSDFEESDVLFFFGSNPVIAHPIMWQRLKRNTREPRVIVVDPRRSETAALEGVEHVALRPKSDISLLYGLARLLIERGWVDEAFVGAHTTGFETMREHVAAFTLERVAADTGLPPESIERLARTIHEGERVSFWWMVGINQGYQAVRTAQAIINLALLTGNIGRPGTGANSITGQCNAMGTRLFGNTSGLWCGRDFASAEHRGVIADVLGIDETVIPRTPGLTYEGILEAVEAGIIKGLWIVCTNPGHSWVDRARLTRVLEKAEFVVVQDLFADTWTARYADLLLPAAGVGEKDGILINSERRLGVVRRVLDPPGDALPDFEIFRHIADAWGCGEMFGAWSSPEAVFQMIKKASRGTPCDFSAIEDYAMLEAEGGVQWPSAAGPVDGQGPAGRERRLFADGLFFHPDAKARLIVEDVAEPPESPDSQYPFVLMTGRGSVTQWHTLTRSDRAPMLKRASPDPAYVEINPADAEERGINEAAWVLVTSRRGQARVRAKATDRVARGQLFMPMHFVEANNLTMWVFDTYSRQPSFKYAAVDVALDSESGPET